MSHESFPFVTSMRGSHVEKAADRGPGPPPHAKPWESGNSQYNPKKRDLGRVSIGFPHGKSVGLQPVSPGPLDIRGNHWETQWEICGKPPKNHGNSHGTTKRHGEVLDLEMDRSLQRLAACRVTAEAASQVVAILADAGAGLGRWPASVGMGWWGGGVVGVGGVGGGGGGRGGGTIRICTT